VWELEVRVRAERPVGLDGDFRPLPEIAPITIVTVVWLVRDSRRIEFTTTLENACRDHRLRAIFPLAGRSEVVRAQSAFALVRRPASAPRPQTDWVEPPDGTQHTLGVVAVGALGLLTQGLPEYEVRSGADGDELCLTLLRCTGLISQPSGVLATRPQSAGPQTRTPEGQCLGRHELRYALILDADELDDVGLLREEQDYRYGFMTVAGGLSFDPPLTMTGDVVFSCLKGAEDGDGLILRCFNPADSDARVAVSGAFAVSRTRLDETSEETAPPDGVVVAANQIATLRLRR
jgi:alpha-mannosidase